MYLYNAGGTFYFFGYMTVSALTKYIDSLC